MKLLVLSWRMKTPPGRKPKKSASVLCGSSCSAGSSLVIITFSFKTNNQFHIEIICFDNITGCVLVHNACLCPSWRKFQALHSLPTWWPHSLVENLYQQHTDEGSSWFDEQHDERSGRSRNTLRLPSLWPHPHFHCPSYFECRIFCDRHRHCHCFVHLSVGYPSLSITVRVNV